MAFYGKYEDDEPTLAQKIAKEINKGKQDDEVRLTARYGNSGDWDGPQDSSPSVKPLNPKPKKVDGVAKTFSDAKVGDYIEGLEALGKVVSISDPSTYEEPAPPLSEKKIAKMRKWLKNKGFSYEGEYEGQHSYWLESKNLAVTTDPKHMIINWNDGLEDEQLFTSVKSAKERVKEIVSV